MDQSLIRGIVVSTMMIALLLLIALASAHQEKVADPAGRTSAPAVRR